jgi:hypothetical protein
VSASIESLYVFQTAAAFCLRLAMERVKRCFLISYVSMGNMLPVMCGLSRPAIDVYSAVKILASNLKLRAVGYAL